MPRTPLPGAQVRNLSLLEVHVRNLSPFLSRATFLQMPKTARQLDEEIKAALTDFNSTPHEAAHAKEVNALLRKYSALVSKDSQDADDWEALHHALIRLIGPLRGDSREIVRARAEEASRRAQRIRSREQQGAGKPRGGAEPGEEAYVKKVNALLHKYTALANADSQDADAWEALHHALTRLMGPLRGNDREIVRSRAADASQRAQRLQKKSPKNNKMSDSEASHAKAVDAALRKYAALQKSQNADALDTVGFELERLMGPLQGNSREIVRSRAVEAHRRATEIRQRAASIGGRSHSRKKRGGRTSRV